jgi:carbon-monoxide dehydrogenase medium subunit
MVVVKENKMKAPDFDYLRPGTLDAALSLLADAGGDAMALAGGQSLLAMMNFRVASPSALIDLVDLVELRGIRREADTLRIGAMTRYAELADSADVKATLPLFGMAIPHIAHDAIRNRGTLGGSIALGDPAAEMPALALALSAAIEVAGPDGSRRIAADDFYLGSYETALAPDELIVAVHYPVARPDQRFGFYELAQRHGDYAMTGTAIVQTGRAYRIAFFGVADRPLRVTALEHALAENPDPAAAQHLLSEIDFSGDVKASPATRQRLTAVALTRALQGMTQ